MLRRKQASPGLRSVPQRPSLRGVIEDRADAQQAAGVVGRAGELAEVTRFLDAVYHGPRLLVLDGEPGIGKTMLWQAGVEASRERRHWILVCRAAEAEAKLGYAALGDLLNAVPDELVDGLDEPQRSALDVALLRSDAEGSRADPRAVSLGLLNLLRALAASETVIVAIDDVQWLDTATARALEFALRRLEREPIGVLASQRIGESRLAYERLLDRRVDTITLGPLEPSHLGEILREGSGIHLSLHTVTRIHRISNGNAFYALEIAHSLEEHGESFLEDHFRVPPSLRALVGQRVAALPTSTRRAVLAASALSAPTIPLIAAATGRRDERVPALAAAEEAGVVEVELGTVRFTHPLLASAVYGDAPPAERRRMHNRLARIVGESEESARHLALAAEGPDANVAQALDDAAKKARSRGALDEAVTLGEQAWRLTPDDAVDDKQRRQVDAGAYHLFAGDTGRARELAQEAATTLPGGAVRARALRQLAALTPNADASRALLEQAIEEASEDPELLARLEGMLVANYMSAFQAENASAHAHAGLAYAKQAEDQGLHASALMDVIWSNWYLGHDAPPELVREALALERFCEPTPVGRLPRQRYALMLHLTPDIAEARATYEALAAQARAYGDEPSLAKILGLLSEIECFAGHYDPAAALAAESHRIALQCENHRLCATSLLRVALVNAHRGDVDAAREAALKADELMREVDELHAVGASAWVLSFLELSVGNPQGAIDRMLPIARPLAECDVVQPVPTSAPIPDLIEALVSVGELEQASFYLRAFERRAEATQNPWALAAAGRSRALLEAAQGRLEAALEATETALRMHAPLPLPFERARTLLVRGVIQRRVKQRRAARESLSQALAIFDELGAKLWAERARAELARIGGRASGDDLTPTEAQVAARAAAGETNREIADALFMSVKTVEANLSRVYRKLDVSSRRQLTGKLERQT